MRYRTARAPNRRPFTRTELVMLFVVVVPVILLMIDPPFFHHRSEKSRRAECASNLRVIGMAELYYAEGGPLPPPGLDVLTMPWPAPDPTPCVPCSSSSVGGFFPIVQPRGSTNFEPLNTSGLLHDGRYDYACPSAPHVYTLARHSNFRYRGSGLKDDNDSATAITIAYDQSGNHPDNQWMNALFIDGHIEGARPDGSKGWNLSD